MKSIIFFCMLLLAACTNAQTFGASGLKIEGTFNTNNPVYGKWLLLGNKSDITIKFKQTADGLSNAVELATKLLLENELDPDSPDYEKTIIKDGSRDNTTSLLNAIMKGTSKINEAWNLPEGSTLHLFLSNQSFEISIIKAYKKDY